MTAEEAKKVIEELKENGMTYEQAENVIEKSKGKGMTDEQICDCLYKMYRDDLIDLDQFDALAKLVKYELKQEFIEIENRRLEKSDLSYILGMELSVIDEINIFKNLIKKVKDKDILEDIKEALYCLRYTLSDETIDYLMSIKKELIDDFYRVSGKNMRKRLN